MAEHIYPGTDKGIEGILAFKGKPKVYQMAYIDGFPHVEVESFYGEGVIVSYLITGVTISWEWKDKEEAWAFARGRQFHVDSIKAAGNAYAQQA